MYFMVNKIRVLIRPDPGLSELYYNPRRVLKHLFANVQPGENVVPFSFSLFFWFLLTLCTIRMASIVYRGHRPPLCIDCAYVNCPSVHFLISGVSPEIHPFCAVGFSLSTTLTSNFKQNNFKTASSDFCHDFPDLFYDSKTSVRRMENDVNHRI
jgi:hypothetical protein